MNKKRGWFLKKSISLVLFGFFISYICIAAYALPVQSKKEEDFILKNSLVSLVVHINQRGGLTYEKIKSNPEWVQKYHNEVFGLKDDGNFNINFMWTAWSAPGKINNANNIVSFSKGDFVLVSHQNVEINDRGKELILLFRGTNNPLEVKITYLIYPNSFFIKKRLSVRDPKLKTLDGGNFLRKIWPVDGKLLSSAKIIKKGGFGQPIAWLAGYKQKAGAFMGLEYPTSTNTITSKSGNILIKCGQIMGQRIDDQWVNSNWIVEALTPEPQVKWWFMKYVSTIDVRPVRPYLLYNSWYDLEAPQLVHSPDRVMNQKNVLNSIRLLRKNLTEEHGVHLNAVVLDDGWDTYKSDWRVSHKQFPHGFKPIVDELRKTGTVLGLWFGPIGGYSHRNWRVDWMKSHGFETIGNEMDIAGPKYHQLFKKRVVNFVAKDHVGYYKWDGIQFSSSNPDNGHLVGVYSRRAVMQSVIDLCRSVRKVNPNVFLNVTSGTWLSPWWVKYTNTIWMQGGDFGYSNIPSISVRDQAMTYRDFALYGDFKKDHFWFPMANLMTHGIIKGRLQKLGDVKEPIDKFANNVLMYLSRGVSMWELYISPDLLTPRQWDVLASGIKWAKANFDQLKHTVMVGGDPGEGATYGYAHFNGLKGIIVVRNPVMQPQEINVNLNHSLGLQNAADSLVIERVYPTRYIKPVLYARLNLLHIRLSGYETAIYQIYPLRDVNRPLLAGAIFKTKKVGNDEYDVTVLNVNSNAGGVHLLNPGLVAQVTYEGQSVPPEQLNIPTTRALSTIRDISLRRMSSNNKNESILQAKFTVPSQSIGTSLAMLLKSDINEKSLPVLTMTVNGHREQPDVVHQQGNWGWFKVPVQNGSNTIMINISKNDKTDKWKGKATLWVRYLHKAIERHLTIEMKPEYNEKPVVLPPYTIPDGYQKKQHKVGEVNIG